MSNDTKMYQFALILPVLFYEYLAISITRSIIPKMIVDSYGDWSYAMVGLMETAKGILAFIACPLFGKLSDRIGRKYCLLASVTGTTLPVFVMAFTDDMWVFAVCMGLSGFFTATFPLTFAYISDCVDKNERAPAYGLALATFGLSFSFGPILGAYMANHYGPRSVFYLSLLLVIINIFYIIFILPETVKHKNVTSPFKLNVALEYLPNSYNIVNTFRVFRGDEFMSNLALIVFLYYTSVWAMVSTLMIHVTRQLHFTAINVAWMLSGYGMATMFSEAVLVRVVVPYFGELISMRIGLAAFALQACCLAFSSSYLLLLASVSLSMLSNLVYPSVSSLLSKMVDESEQGEALGALNGIKAITEGFGPLLFGSFMLLFEDSPVPGAPYILVAVIAAFAFLHSYELPPQPDGLINLKYLHSKKGNSDNDNEEEEEEQSRLIGGETEAR